MSAPMWLLTTEHLRELLERAAAGEDIDVMLAEAYANAEGRDG